MKQYLFAAFLVIVFFDALGQGTANIKGAVVDSLKNKPLESVTISITSLKDSSFISFASSSKDGSFSMKNIPSGKAIIVTFSCVGYKSKVKLLTLKKDVAYNFGQINMHESNRALKEIIVEEHIQSVVINQDTIEFNAASFKVRPNAVVEDLLKKLPGIQIDNDGSISANGRPIAKLLIDGKEFFSNDPRIASKNLDADMIAKVQIYDDRENDPDHLIDASRLRKIINLKLKKAFRKSYIGKAYAGVGTQDRFEGGALLASFRDTLQISLISIGNNLNKTGFSSNDLSKLGGFDRSGQEDILNGTLPLNSQVGSGIEKVLSTGVNINNDYGQRLKMNLIYFYNNTDDNNINKVFNQQYLSVDTILSLSNYLDNRSKIRQNINGIIQYKPDTATIIRFLPKTEFNHTSSATEGLLNRSNISGPLYTNKTHTTNNGFQGHYEHTLMYYKRLKRPGNTITFTNVLNLNPASNDNFINQDIVSQSSSVVSEYIRRFINTKSSSSNVSLEVDYRFPIGKKIIGTLNLSENYFYDRRQLSSFDQDPNSQQYSVMLPNQSTDYNRTIWKNAPKVGLLYRFKKNASLETGSIGEFGNVHSAFNAVIPDRINNYFVMLPYAKLQVAGYSIAYRTRLMQPTINNLQPITLTTSKQYAFIGNPDLKFSYIHTIELYYSKYFTNSEANLNVSLSGSTENNTIINQTVQSSTGAITLFPINANGKHSLHGYFNYGRKIKRTESWQIRYNASINASQTQLYYLLNSNSGLQENLSLNIRQQATINWDNLIEVTPSITLNPQRTTYPNSDFQSVSFVSQKSDVKYLIWGPSKFYWEGNYSYAHNPTSSGFQGNTHLLNSSVALRMFKKDRGELKLSCYDILNQNFSVVRVTSTNAIVDAENSALKRYFLLTFLYKFNKTLQ